MNKKTSKNALELLIEEISNCEDYRIPSKIEYTLIEVIFLTFCGSVAGCETYNEIEDFGHLKRAWLSKYLVYENGIPSHDTINRVMSMLNPKELEKLLINWSTYDLQLPNGAVISIDGKWISKSATIKEQQTKKAKGGKQAVHMVNAYCSSLNSCLATMRVESKSHEKEAVESILDLLDLSECIITLDAGGCYQRTVEKIRSSNADYVIGLKGNQKNLRELTESLFKQQGEHDGDETDLEKDHGRVDKRWCKVLNINRLKKEKVEGIELFENWKDLNTLIKIDSSRRVESSGKKSFESRYYISSLKLKAKDLSKIIRTHWSVENNLHWMLDVIMGEDNSRKRIGNAAANYSVIRKMALNQLKSMTDNKVSIKRRMKKCLMSEDYLDLVLSST